jgi:hypothetical protein
MPETKPATMTEVKNYFGYTSTASFAADWRKLTDEDKEQLKNGIGDGSLTY